VNISNDLAPTTTYQVTEIPGIPESTTNYALILSLAILLSGVALVLVLAVSMCCCVSSENRLLTKLDLLTLQKVNQESRDPQYGFAIFKKYSALGGFFTISAVILIAATLGAYLTQVIIDNSFATVSLLSGTPSPRNAYSYSLTIAGYTGPCTALQPGVCSSELITIARGFNQGGVFSCQSASPNTCQVEWRCTGSCSTIVPNNGVSISVSTDSQNVFALSYSYSFSSLDYGGEPSTVMGVVSAPSNYPVMFKGIPFQAVALSATTAHYESYGGSTQQGVLMNFVASSDGNLVTPDSFASGQGVGFVVDITVNPNLLSVQVQSKQNYVSVIAQILAIISGMFTACRFLLDFSDKTTNIRRKPTKSSEGPSAELTPAGTFRQPNTDQLIVDVE